MNWLHFKHQIYKFLLDFGVLGVRTGGCTGSELYGRFQIPQGSNTKGRSPVGMSLVRDSHIGNLVRGTFPKRISPWRILSMESILVCSILGRTAPKAGSSVVAILRFNSKRACHFITQPWKFSVCLIFVFFSGGWVGNTFIHINIG